MISGEELIQRLQAGLGEVVDRRFLYPFTYLEFVDPGMNADPDAREAQVARAAGLDVGELREMESRLFLRIHARTPEERSNLPASRGEFWVRALQEAPGPSRPARLRCLHFFGPKGGQGRSSVLGCLAFGLAQDGWRVLGVDLDAEAPSLDVLFQVAAPALSSSVVGLRAGAEAAGVRAYTAPDGRGWVDVLPFRPSGETYDLDAAALAMEMAVHPAGNALLAERLEEVFEKGRYDLVLFDHRTGLSPIVLPWIHALPGQVLVFARLDGQWRGAVRLMEELWSIHRETPGVVVSWAPPGVDRKDLYTREPDQVQDLLQALASATAVGGEDLEPDDLRDHFVPWPYDNAFERVGLPAIGDLGGATRDALRELRRLTNLGGRHPRAEVAPALSPSGGADEGTLIETNALRQLRVPNNRLDFILGRKGTGKTRLVRALAEEGLGEPLLVPPEMPAPLGGVSANYAALGEFFNATPDHEGVWWRLLTAALAAADVDRPRLQRALDPKVPATSLDAREAAKATAGPRTFLIDGLETAFPRSHTFSAIAALLRVVAGVEADPDLRDRVRLKVFIRTDLAQRGFENFEQQSHNRTLALNWDTQSILNFALSRISQLAWFQKRFPAYINDLRERHGSELTRGSLGVETCEACLLRFFPERLPRFNLLTTTFLRTYFSDDPQAQSSFYPRVYDDFLRVIGGEDRAEYRGKEIIDGRVDPDLIYLAHERATERFLAQVRAELRNVVDLDEGGLASLIDNMNGTITPFSLDKRVGELSKKTGTPARQVRQAMERMKELGIFEDRPKYPGQWRAGRLFKSSLKMKFNRG